jgi:hypothetical protein
VIVAMTSALDAPAPARAELARALRGQSRIRYSDEESLTRFARARARSRARESRQALCTSRGHGWPQALAVAARGRSPSLHGRAGGPRRAAAASDAENTGPVVLDGASVRRLRGDRGLRDSELRRAAGMPLSESRGARGFGGG